MNSRTKKLVSLLCVAAMLVSALPMSALAADEGEHDHSKEGCLYVNGAYVCNPDVAPKDETAAMQNAALFTAPRSGSIIYKEGGWLESAYIEWTIGSGVQKYEVDVKEKNATTWTKLDNELVREYPGYMRADALGLKAGTYQMRVRPDGKEDGAFTSGDLTVEAHDRSGYGFVGGSSSGAYNDDGTLKADANVIYITQKTASTVKLGVDVKGKGAKDEMVGLPGILMGYKKGRDKTPLCIRFVGTVANDYTSAKTRLPSPWTGMEITGKGPDGAATTLNDSTFKGDVALDGFTGGVTIEGVGIDATVVGIGFRVKNCTNVEIRNLGIMSVNSGELDNIGFQPDCSYVWAHNNDIFYGMPGKDSDQVKGDGALDTKGVNHASLSYNHFWDVGKSNLCGLKDNMDYMTYHHNWYDHSDSRHPRIRYTAHAHIYNNYYDGNAKYGVGATTGSSVFVENNYFRNCNHPVLISMQGTDEVGGGTFSGEAGGMIKMYGNTIEGGNPVVSHTQSATDFDAYVAGSRDERVPDTYKTKKGGTTYNNFDTASDFYRYSVDAPTAAKEKVMKYAGRVEGGDFKFTFNNVTDDQSYEINSALSAELKSYEPKMMNVGGIVTQGTGGEHTEHTYGSYVVTTPATCTTNGVETRTCLFPDCGHTDTRVIPGGHKYVNGECTICHEKEPAGGDNPGPSGGTVNKELKASDFKMTGLASDKKNAPLTVDELAKVTDYFTMVGTVNKRLPSEGSATDNARFLDLAKDGSNGIQFTVSTSATVAISWGNVGKGTEKASSILVKDSADTVIKTETLTTDKKSGTTSTTLELEAGTYIVASPAGQTNPARLYSITVMEKTAETGHQWGEWKVVRLPTCGEDGLDERFCSKCGSRDTRSPVATGEHTWGEWKDVGDGMEERECSKCHETETKASGSDEPTPPTPTDKTGLTDIIAKAKTYLSGVAENTDAANVPVGTSWALKVDIDAFKTAIANAQTVADKADATADDVSKATTALSTAIATFAGKIKDGTKPNGGSSTTGTSYVLDISEEVEKGLATAGFPAATPATKVENLGTNGVFTIFAKATGGSGVKKKDSSTTFTDYAGEYGFNTSGSVADDKLNNLESDGKNISFTTNAVTTVKVWWASASQNGSSLGLATKAGNAGPTKITTDAKCARHVAQVTTIENVPAGTQYVYGTDGSIIILRIEATETSGSDDPTPSTPTVDKTALNDAIADAKAKLAAAVESKDGSDVEPSKNWATKENKELLAAKIALADLAAKTAKTEADVKAALDELKTAVAVLRPGTKTDTSDNPGSGGSSGGGGGGGGGGSSSSKKPTGQITGTAITMSSNTTADRVAVSELTDSQAKTLIDNAIKGKSDEIVVNVNAPRSAAGVSLNVSANTLKNMSGKTDAALALQTPVGNVRFPHAAVADLGGNGGKDVSFTIARTDNGMKVTVTSGDKILNQLDGGVTVVANANENGDVAYILTADGSEELLQKSYVEDGKLYANLPGSGEIVLKDNSKTFRDVENNWAKPGIDFAASRELFNGVNELDFAPNQAMTRSMLVTVLYRLEGAKGGAANKFADVPADSWYTEAVAWASAQGVVSGKSATHFGPDDDITREQLATILYRYATKLCGMSEVGKDSKALEKFSDRAVVSGFAEDGMAWCVEQGIIGGRGDGTLAPGGFTSRAEVATMLMRFVKAIV